MCLCLWTVTRQLTFIFILNTFLSGFFFLAPPAVKQPIKRQVHFYICRGRGGGCHLLMQESLISPSENKVEKTHTLVSQALAVMPKITMFKRAMSDEDCLLLITKA